jgi:hypothetical protein
VPRLEWDCKLNWQSPGDGVKVAPRHEFSTGWKITNTGGLTWSPERVTFTYLSGAQLHHEAVVQLKSGVAPGGSVILTVDMTAPRNRTQYTTYWALRQGDEYFCRVGLTILVK